MINDDTNIKWSETVTLNVSQFFTDSGSLWPSNQCCDFSSTIILPKLHCLILPKARYFF